MPWWHLLLLLLLQVTLLWLNNVHAGGSTMECYTQGGPPYNGTLNKTAAGEPCLPWSDFTHLRLRSNWNASVLLEHANYCRNPDDDPRGPWCMVTKAKYGTCAIPHCGKCSAYIHPTVFSNLNDRVSSNALDSALLYFYTFDLVGVSIHG